MSLYLSTIGIMKGPSIFLFSDGRSSMKGMKAGPLQKCHLRQFLVRTAKPKTALAGFILCATVTHRVSPDFDEVFV
jgi:hypothetical protein